MMKTLAIIISYNFMPWIDRCLPSLLKGTHPTDILVVDNGSSDETIAHIREHYPSIRLIENKRNLGFGAANNIGMQIALDEGYDGVMLINQDAWLASDALQQLVEVSLQHPEYGIISPKHLTGDGSKMDPGFASYISTINNCPFLEQRGQSQACLNYAESRQNWSEAQLSIINCQFINAALWYLPTSVIRKVGMFAPLFYHYGEDKDYVNRIHYHGYQIGYVPTALGYHDRAERPFNRPLFLRTEYVYHLSEYANINYSLAKAFAMGVLAPVKKAFQALTKGKWLDFSAFIGMSFQLLLKTSQVVSGRKEAKCYTLNP
jgi:GT2 family glycosyltransferase